MKTRTKLEQTSLATLSRNTMEKVDVTFDKEKIDQSKLSKLGKYFGSKSPKVIVKSALDFVVSALMKPELDLLDLTNYDRMGLIKTLKNKMEPAAKIEKNMIKISIPLWMVAIIASNSEDALSSGEGLVIYSLVETLRRLSMLSGEGKEHVA
jgi:hypothetical protein